MNSSRIDIRIEISNQEDRNGRLAEGRELYIWMRVSDGGWRGRELAIIIRKLCDG